MCVDQKKTIFVYRSSNQNPTVTDRSKVFDHKPLQTYFVNFNPVILSNFVSHNKCIYVDFSLILNYIELFLFPGMYSRELSDSP